MVVRMRDVWDTLVLARVILLLLLFNISVRFCRTTVTSGVGKRSIQQNILFPKDLNGEQHWSMRAEYKENLHLRTVPTIVIAHTFCASRDTRISYCQCLLIQGYFCAVQNYAERAELTN